MKIRRLSAFVMVLVLAFSFCMVGCKKTTVQYVSEYESDIWNDQTSNDNNSAQNTGSGADKAQSGGSTTSQQTGTTSKNNNNGFGTGNSNGKVVTDDEEIPGLPKLSSKVKNKTVKYLTHVNASSTNKSATKRYIKQYDLTVEYITVPYENKRTKLVQMIAAGDSPDLISMDEMHMTLINNNLVQPAEQYFDNFSDKVWNKVRNLQNERKVKGKIYEIILHAVPSRMLFYNAQVFKNASLKDPLYWYEKGQWNWSKLEELAKKLTKDQNNDGITDQYGFGGESLAFMVMGSVNESFIKLDKNGKVVNNLKSANLAKAMKFFVDLQTTFKVWPPSPSFSDIVNGKLAMGYFGAWNIFTVEGAEKKFNDGQIQFVPSPTADGMKKNYNFPVYESVFIPKGAKNPYGAAAFVMYTKYQEANAKSSYPAKMQKIYDEASSNLMTSISNRDFDFTGSFEWTITGDLLNGKSWSTLVAENSPKLDSSIAQLN